jgi:hypothetical protein
MYGLMGALIAAGSEVKIGFEYGSTATSAQSINNEDSPGWIRDVITGVLSGYFDSVNVTVTPPAYAGLQHGYILIQGRLWQDVNSVIDLESGIESAITNYSGLPITLTRRDSLHVLSVPQNRPGVQQPFDPTRTQQSGQPGKCNWDTQSIGDYLSCQLGLDTKTSVGIGAIGALAAVLVVVAVLKR